MRRVDVDPRATHRVDPAIGHPPAGKHQGVQPLAINDSHADVAVARRCRYLHPHFVFMHFSVAAALIWISRAWPRSRPSLMWIKNYAAQVARLFAWRKSHPFGTVQSAGWPWWAANRGTTSNVPTYFTASIAALKSSRRRDPSHARTRTKATTANIPAAARALASGSGRFHGHA